MKNGASPDDVLGFPIKLSFTPQTPSFTMKALPLPEISLQPQPGTTIAITFSRTLQSSADLVHWTDVALQPTSPAILSVSGPQRFYRALMNY